MNEAPTPLDTDRLESRLAGLLLGTALGDALGLPTEGLNASTIARRFGDLDRFRLCGRTGYVSDDTEQTVLVAESLLRHPNDSQACARDLQRRLVRWFWRLPFGVGLATVRASLKATVGIASGVPSAGNGAAMRAGVIGAFFREDPERRREYGSALAQVTHTDSRAVEAAHFVAEVAALCLAASDGRIDSAALERTIANVEHREVQARLTLAAELATTVQDLQQAAKELGTSGYVLHSVPFALYCLLRHHDDPMDAIRAAIRGGGDTDSNAAIVGGWVGALHGEAALPEALLAQIHDGPFGPTHLRRLARALVAGSEYPQSPIPQYSAPVAMGRNLALYPVVLCHGFRRLFP